MEARHQPTTSIYRDVNDLTRRNDDGVLNQLVKSHVEISFEETRVASSKTIECYSFVRIKAFKDV